MARRKHRRMGGMVSLPLGSFIPPLRADVSAMDVVLGAGTGFVGTNVLDALLSNVLGATWGTLKTSLGNLFPAAAGFAVGTLANLIGPKVGFIGKKRGEGLFWGAVAYGATATLQNFLRGMTIPGTTQTFQDVVALPIGGYNYGGLLVDNPVPQRMNGLLVDNPVPQRSNLAALGQLSMADDYDGMDALASM